jgi:hypothetical protein
MSGNGFLSRILGRDADEDRTGAESTLEIGTRRSWRKEPEVGWQPRVFTPELAAEMIDGFPSDVSRESVACIVRRTLDIAGIEIEDFDRYTQARIPKLRSEIELARNRQKEFREKTADVVRSLEEEIRKAREVYKVIFSKEEQEISRASKELENIERVRAFFGFPDIEGEENTNAHLATISLPGRAQRRYI